MARAILRRFRESPRKMRVGRRHRSAARSVDEAMSILRLMPQKAAAHAVARCSSSAIANAEREREGATSDKLVVIQRSLVDGGPIAEALDAALDGPRQPHQPPHERTSRSSSTDEK